MPARNATRGRTKALKRSAYPGAFVASEGSTEMPVWVGSALTASVLLAILFAAAVAGHIAIPVWVGWAVVITVVTVVLVAGYVIAVRVR